MTTKSKYRAAQTDLPATGPQDGLELPSYKVGKLTFFNPNTGKKECQFDRDMRANGFDTDPLAMKKINASVLTLRSIDQESRGITPEGKGIFSMKFAVPPNKVGATLFFGIDGAERYVLAIGKHGTKKRGAQQGDVSRAKVDAGAVWDTYRNDPSRAALLPVVRETASRTMTL